MKCKWCNSEVQENAKFCTNCGGNLMETISEKEVNSVNSIQEEESANIWLVIVSVLFPLAGLIIFLCNKDTNKKTAKASGIAALISVGVSVLTTIIFIIVATVSFKNKVIPAVGDLTDKLTTEIQEQIDNIDSEMDSDIDKFMDQAEENMNELEDQIQGSVSIDSKWKNYAFAVNGKSIKLPCSYSELSSSTSATMKSSDAKSYISPSYYSLVNLYKNDKLALYIEVLNDTTVDQLYTNGKITRVSQTKYQKSVGATELTFPGNLKVDQKITKDEIIKLFGQPQKIDNYSSDGYVKDTYLYTEDSTYTTRNFYEIIVVNGVIDQLTLDNRNYK